MDCSGQQAAEAYWSSGAKGDFHPSRILFPPIFLPLPWFFCLTSHSSLHLFHLVFTSLAQINRKSLGVGSRQYQQITSAKQHPPTYKRMHICTVYGRCGPRADCHSCYLHVLNVAWNQLGTYAAAWFWTWTWTFVLYLCIYSFLYYIQ